MVGYLPSVSRAFRRPAFHTYKLLPYRGIKNLLKECVSWDSYCSLLILAAERKSIEGFAMK